MWLPVHPVKMILRNDIIFISVIYFMQRYGREVYDEHIFHKNNFISVMTMTHSSAIFPVWQYCERTQPFRWLVALEESWNSPQMCIQVIITDSITLTSIWPPWRLESPASWLFTQSFIQAQIKKNIKAPGHWPLCGNSPGSVNSPHKGPVTRKMFPFDDVIMAELEWICR